MYYDPLFPFFKYSISTLILSSSAAILHCNLILVKFTNPYSCWDYYIIGMLK